MSKKTLGRRRRTWICVNDGGSISSGIAKEIRGRYQVHVLQAPQEGLVMIKMREQARNSLFFIGEILVYQAKVQIGKEVGIGIVHSKDSTFAENLAVIDAAWRAGLPGVEKWEELLLEREKELLMLKSEEEARIQETRVDFRSMQEEEPL